MKNDDFEITKEVNQDGVAKITVTGYVNSINAPELQYELEDTIKEGHKNIVLNMSRVEFLSSIGVRTLLKIYKQAGAAGGKFNIERPSEVVRNVLGIAALNDMLIK